MTEEHGATPLRGRVLASILIVTVLAVTLFAVPLAFAVQRLYRNEAVTALPQATRRPRYATPSKVATWP
jgi:hypothetical protein